MASKDGIGAFTFETFLSDKTIRFFPSWISDLAFKQILSKESLSSSPLEEFLKNISKDLTNNSPVVKILDSYLNHEVPVNISKGGVIRKGINKDLDKYRDLLNNGKNYLNRILEREIKNTQIPSLKINFNKEFDDLFSCYPILITNKKVKEKKLKIRTYSTFDIPEIETILKKFNTKSLIIRPDRFVLASTDKSDLKEFSRFYLNEIFAS